MQSQNAQAPAAPSSQSSHEALPVAEMFPGKYQPVYMSGLSFSIILVLVLLAKLFHKKGVPGKLQAAWEFVYEWVAEATEQIAGPEGLNYLPLFLCMFLYILVENLLGLFPTLESPTSKLDTTVPLALITFLSTHALGIRKKGFSSYVGHYFHLIDSSQEKGVMKLILMPVQYLMLPVLEWITELARPVTLAVRLYGNIMAKEVLLMVLAGILLMFWQTPGPINKALISVPLILRPGILVLGVLVGIIQAAVFTGLSMAYIGGAIAVHEEHGHEGHEAEGHAA